MEYALEAFVCAEHFTEDSFEQNLALRNFLRPLFKLRQLVLWKAASRLKWKNRNDEKTEKNPRRTAGKLLDPFPSKIGPKLSLRTIHWRRNGAMINTKHLIPFLPFKCAVILETFSWSHRLSALSLALSFFTPFHAWERKIPDKFPLKCLFKHFVALKWLRKRCLKFGSLCGYTWYNRGWATQNASLPLINLCTKIHSTVR